MRERKRGGSRRGRERGEVREHQNKPMWARSGGRDGEGCPNIRTSPHGLVLMFKTRERERGGARAPERARAGTFWCSRQGRGRGEVRKHQKVPTWALSGVRNEGGEEGTPERAHKGTFWCLGCGDVPNMKNMPPRACFLCLAGGGHLGLVVGGRSGALARFPWRGTCWGCWGSS